MTSSSNKRTLFAAGNGTLLFAALGFGLVFAASTHFLTVPIVAVGLVGLVTVAVCLHNTFVAAVLLLAAMLFSPEFELAGGARVRAEDLIIPCLVIALAARFCIHRFRLSIRFSPLDAPVLFVVAVNVVASIRGALSGHVDPFSSVLWNAKVIELFLIYWIAFNYIRNPRQVRLLVYLLILVLVAVCAYTYFQIPGTEVHTIHRLTAPFEGTPEPTTLGGYLTLLLAIVMAMAIYEPAPRRRLLLWALCVAVLVPILFTLSRTTYVACAVMVFLLAFVTRHRGLLVGSTLALLASPFLLPDKVVGRVMMTFDAARRYGLDSAAAERIDVWRKAGYALRESTFLGFGLPQTILDSQFARTIIESGILGLLGWLSVLLVCALMAIRLHRRADDPLHKALAAGYFVGVIAITIHALAAITFYIVRIMEPFWFLTGVVASLDAHYLAKRKEAEPCAASAVSSTAGP